MFADAAHDGNGLYLHLARIASTTVICPGPRRAGPPPTDRVTYQRRNRTERFMLKLERYRAIAKRDEERNATLLALIKLTEIRV